MEPHKSLPPEYVDLAPRPNFTFSDYFDAAVRFTRTYYGAEYQKIAGVSFSALTIDKFFSEYIWVVHATGFSASAVGKFIPRLMDIYVNPRKTVSVSFSDLYENVRLVCNNPAKSKAIYKTAALLEDMEKTGRWESYKNTVRSSPEVLAELPYIGKVTCHHLARNIGLLDHVKPDLHLVRLANHFGFSDANAMVKAMNMHAQLPLGLADLCLWYYASTFGTTNLRIEGLR